MKFRSRSARAVAVGGTLSVVASLAGIALTQAPALAGSNAGTSYEYDCTTALQAGQTGPFEIVTNLAATPDPSFYQGGSFGAAGALTFPIPGSEAAGLAANGITATGLTVSGLTIASTDGTATGSYTYGHTFASQTFPTTTVSGVSWTSGSTTLTASAGSFSASEVGDGIGATTGIPSTAVIVAVAGGGASATISAATTAAGSGALTLYAPLAFTDSSVSTGNVFGVSTTLGSHANIGIVPGTANTFTLTTSLGINVPFGGTTGIGTADCVQTGWTAASVPGPIQTNATTPVLPPEALGGATSLLSVTSGFTQAGTTVKITPPAAAYVVATDPAPSSGSANVSLGVGGSKTITLPNSSNGGTATTGCAVSTAPSDPRLAVSISNSPSLCQATLTDSGSGPATVTFQYTVSNTNSTSSPGTVTVNIGTPPVDEPLSQVVNPGQLVLSCADPTLPISLHCDTLNLPAITLNGVQQTSTGAGSTLYVEDNRGDPTSGWGLQASVVPSSGTDNTNASCAGLADFCNESVGTHALDASGNGQIAASKLAISGIGCAAHAGNLNPAAVPAGGGNFGSTQAICSAAAGYSGGTFDVTKTYTLTIPASVYAGTYVGTVEYLVS
ncbi:MAG TPA: hypothetical protein VMH41_13805 [Mycobacteriales bacterium]|nr:hypothetical protein [Mycobacteriales bacterium]